MKQFIYSQRLTRSRGPLRKGKESGIFYRERENTSSSWSVPWSDLMMVMFILFLVLFVYSTKLKEIPRNIVASLQPHVSAPVPAEMKVSLHDQKVLDTNLTVIYERLAENLGDFGKVTHISFDQGHGVIIALHGETFFDPGRTDLNVQAWPVLERIARILALTRSQVLITGFSDHHSRGTSRVEDWEMSAMRAAQVARYFTGQSEIDPDILVIQGYGSASPKVPSTTNDNKTKNQRVEITITRTPV